MTAPDPYAHLTPAQRNEIEAALQRAVTAYWAEESQTDEVDLGAPRSWVAGLVVLALFWLVSWVLVAALVGLIVWGCVAAWGWVW